MNKNMKFDTNIELSHNAMLKHKPELFYKWDFKKNNSLGLDVYKVTHGSGDKAWWNCLICNNNYFKPLFQQVRGGKCPRCRDIAHEDSLASHSPDIASEWHPYKNGELRPNHVAPHSKKKVWWLGKCGHEWDAAIGSRTKVNGTGCPYCSNYKALKGFSDMWTTNRELASLLADPRDGYKYMQMSNKRVNWKCPNCNEIKTGMIKNRIISSDLAQLLDLRQVSWQNVFSNCSKSLNSEILKLWNDGLSVKEITEIMMNDRKAVVRTLKKYESAGMCIYDSNRGVRKGAEKRVYQFDKNMNFIDVFHGYKEIKERGYDPGYVSLCCRGKKKYYKKHIWIYEKDLDVHGLGDIIINNKDVIV